METGHVAAVHRFPFGNIPSFPKLFATYCTDYSQLSDFYSGNPFDDDDLKAAAERAAAFDRDRNTLADVLLEQNARWGLDDATRARIEALRDGSAVAVVTGQQLGIFGGPLYTQFKTITTIQLAAHLEKMTGRQTVPVFWLAGEDHDFAEVASVRISPDESVSVDNPGSRGPVGRLVVNGITDTVLENVRETFKGSDGAGSLISTLENCYEPGSTWADAFARYVKWLFPETGLVVMSGDDERLKALASPLFAKALESYDQLNEQITHRSSELAERFHAQLTPRTTNLFVMTDELRSPVDPSNGGFTTVSGDIKSLETLKQELDQNPGTFSPNVVLRPIMQDTLLPTAAYIAGPGETSYFGQLKPAYEWADVPMPIIYPRASATIIENHIARLMEKEDVSFEDVDTDIARMFTRVVRGSMDEEILSVFDRTRSRVQAQLEELAKDVASFDPTLKKSALSIGSTLEKEIGRLHGKVVKAEKQKQETTRNRLQKISGYVYPGGVLQERTLAAVHFIARYDREFIATMLQALPLDTSEHIVLEL